MPYKSKAQSRKFHAMAKKGQIKKSTVKEFDQSTDFSNLPNHVATSAAKARNANARKKGGGMGGGMMGM
jgi:hypothetical protein